RGDQKNRRGFFLLPSQKRAEHARGTRIGAVAKTLLNLVHPEHTRRDRLGGAKRLAQRVFGGAFSIKNRAEIQAQKWKAPITRDGLRAQTLAAALHAQKKQPFWRGQPKRAGLLAKRALSLAEPALKRVESANIAQSLLKRK